MTKWRFVVIVSMARLSSINEVMLKDAVVIIISEIIIMSNLKNCMLHSNNLSAFIKEEFHNLLSVQLTPAKFNGHLQEYPSVDELS